MLLMMMMLMLMLSLVVCVFLVRMSAVACRFVEWQAPSRFGRPPPLASPSAFGLRLGGDW